MTNLEHAYDFLTDNLFNHTNNDKSLNYDNRRYEQFSTCANEDFSQHKYKILKQPKNKFKRIGCIKCGKINRIHSEN